MSEQDAPPKRIGTGLAGPGRPSSYTEEIAAEICLRLSEGESLRAICRDEHMPDRTTVFNWEDAHPVFSTKLAQARVYHGDWVVDDIASIEAGVLAGKIPVDAGRVAIWSKQWRAGKLSPKRYGDKVIKQLTGLDGGPIKSEATVTHVADDAFGAIIAALDSAGRAKSSGGGASS